MIRHGMRYRSLKEVEHKRQECEHNERLQQLHTRWRSFNLPVQEELLLHLRLFGLDAAYHTTTIIERFLTFPSQSETTGRNEGQETAKLLFEYEEQR